MVLITLVSCLADICLLNQPLFLPMSATFWFLFLSNKEYDKLRAYYFYGFQLYLVVFNTNDYN